MKKQSSPLFWSLVVLALGCFSGWGSTAWPQAGADVPVLRARNLDAGQFAQVEAMLKAQSQPYVVIDEDQLDGLNDTAATPLLAPLTPALSAHTLHALQRRVQAGGALILMAPSVPPDKPMATFLAQLGFLLEGTLSAPSPLRFQWVMPAGAASEPTASPQAEIQDDTAQLPAGSSLLRLSPRQGEMRIAARWSNGSPAIVSRGRVTLLNWPWGHGLSARSQAAILARQLASTAPRLAVASAAPSPPLVIETAPLALPPAPVRASAPTAAAQTEKAVIPPPATAARPQPSMPAASSPKAASHPTPAKPAQKPSKATGDDPLLNDQAMLGAPASGPDESPPPATPDTSGADRATARLKDLAETRYWLNDALESALIMELELPVRAIQAQLVQARYHETAALLAARRKDPLRQDYELDQARRLLAQARVMATPSARVEGRAIWLDRGSIVDTRGPQGLRKLINRLADAGMNVIYFETFNAGYPVYPSQILPQNPLIENWDPLAVALEEAHKRGIELHAWVWCFAVGNTRHNGLVGKPPPYAGPVLEEAGLMGEALRMASGSNLPPRQTEFWLSPASRRGRAFLLSVYQEIVSRYAVDGLQLDYIRYPFQRVWEQAGYEDASRVRFAQETGVTIDRLNDASLKAFIAWKTHQVNTFTQEVSQTLRAIRPSIRISAAVFPMARAERIMAIQQDWETWIAQGWVDALNPMIYTSSRRLFQGAVTRILGDAHQKAFVYPGVAIFRLDADEMLGHLAAIREQGGMGSTLFAFAQLDSAKQDALRQGPYKSRDAVPPHRDALAALNAELSGFARQFARLQTPLSPCALSPARAEALNQTLAELNSLGQRLAKASPPPEIREAFHAALKSLNDGVAQWHALEAAVHPYRLGLFEDSLIRINALSAHLALSVPTPPVRLATP